MNDYGLEKIGEVRIGEQSYWFSNVKALPPALKNGDYKIIYPNPQPTRK